MDITSHEEVGNYEWIKFFKELSEVFLSYENKQKELINILNNAGVEKGFEDKDKERNKFRLEQIDPFSAWSLIIKYGEERRTGVLKQLKSALHLKSDVPNSFDGVPGANAQQAWYFPYSYERTNDHVLMLWELFRQGLNGQVDAKLFEALLNLKMVGAANLTAGLFCSNPEKFFPINIHTRQLLAAAGISHAILTYDDYDRILKQLKASFPNESFYQLSYRAWLDGNENGKNAWYVAQGVEQDEEIDLDAEIESGYDTLLKTTTTIDSDIEASEDLLSRKEFSAYLAAEISALMERTIVTVGKSKSTIFNLYGAWGSGKSTFVNMLKQELVDKNINVEEKEKKWMTVDFNAWKNQHIKPVWWSLFDQISRQLNDQETCWFNRKFIAFKEYCWRFNVAYGFWFLVPIIAILIVSGFEGYELKDWKTIAALATSGIALLSAGVMVMQTIFSGGAGVAKVFQSLHRDPHRYILKHYEKVLKIHNDRPVFIFIDDLDRCKSEYVVELLENLHTLFSDKRVFFFVAADRAWISSCFEEVYDGKGNQIEEMGKTKGYLYIEKIFQVSIGLPVVTQEIKRKFLSAMLVGDETVIDNSIGNEADTIEVYLQEAETEDELAAIGHRLKEQGLSAEKIVEVSTKLSGSEPFRKARKHRLARFMPLMDTNPRNIILLINVYGIYINLYRMGGRVQLTAELLDQIALWAILNIRFPRLAEFIESDVKVLDVIEEFYDNTSGLPLTGAYEKLPDNIKLMLNNYDVKEVIRGGYIGTTDQEKVIYGLNRYSLGELIGFPLMVA
jgi:GTPase SAR1 family protein